MVALVRQHGPEFTVFVTSVWPQSSHKETLYLLYFVFSSFLVCLCISVYAVVYIIIIYYHTQKRKKTKFKPRDKIEPQPILIRPHRAVNFAFRQLQKKKLVLLEETRSLLLWNWHFLIEFLFSLCRFTIFLDYFIYSLLFY